MSLYVLSFIFARFQSSGCVFDVRISALDALSLRKHEDALQ